jgi:hypothetical protein|tara:strand:+ start:147 stop:359 length:213 start_codon:yes stop_codon:yes gene_type:complete
MVEHTKEQIEEMKSVMLEVKNRIPNNRIDFIWNKSQDILGTKVAKPCSCGSAAKYWRDAVNTINEYLKDK